MTPFQLTHVLESVLLGGISKSFLAMHNLKREMFPKAIDDDAFGENEITSWNRLFAALEENCIELDLGASLATVRKIRAVLASQNLSHSAAAPLQIELQGRLTDEMKGKTFWALNLRETELYSAPRKGWEEIINRFPETVMDVEEASKCFALSRYAAAVFHSLQVVETGLIELGRVLVINDPMPGWSATTNRLKAILNVRYPNRTSFQQQHSSVLEQIDATTEVLKGAWRNKVSHVHGKLVLMTRDFAPEIAEEILVASRGFMRRLATEAPISQDPDA